VVSQASIDDCASTREENVQHKATDGQSSIMGSDCVVGAAHIPVSFLRLYYINLCKIKLFIHHAGGRRMVKSFLFMAICP
jgi:hypothetical protein